MNPAYIGRAELPKSLKALLPDHCDGYGQAARHGEYVDGRRICTRAKMLA